MAETGEQQLSVVKEKAVKDQVPAKESMSPETATAILKAIVKTPIDSFTQHSDLSKVGQYSNEDIRQAIELMTRKALGKKFGFKRGEREKYPGGEKIAKLRMDKEYVELSCASYKRDTEDPDYDRARGTIRMTFAVTTNFSAGQTKFQFVDHRKEIPGVRHTLEYANSSNRTAGSQLTGGDDQKLDQFKTLFKGLQWLSINILNWDDAGFILPEDLNNTLPANSQPLATEK